MKNRYSSFKIIYLFLNILFLFNFTFIYSQLTKELSQSEPEVEEVIEFDPDEERELEVLPIQPPVIDGKEVKIGLTMNFPILGDITLYPEKDKNGKEILKANLTTKSIDFGAFGIKIDNFAIIIDDNKIPGVSADVMLFGKKATLELVELKKESKIVKKPIPGTKYDELELPIDFATFRIKFINKPIIPLLPFKSIELNHLDLIVKKQKKPALVSNVNIFGYETQMSYASEQKDTVVSFHIKKIALSDFISEAKGSDFGNASLNDLTLKSRFSSKEVEGATANKELNSFALDFSGFADFSNLKVAGLSDISLNKLNIKGTYSKDKGLDIESNVNKFNISALGSINQAKLIFYSTDAIKNKIAEVKKKLSDKPTTALEELERHELKLLTLVGREHKPLIMLIGNGIINLPEIGPLSFNLDSNYASTGFEIKGTIAQDVKYSNFAINQAMLELNTNTGVITIEGDAVIQGFDVLAKLSAAPDPKDPKNKVYKLEAQTKKKEWQPFKEASVPDFIKDIDIKEISSKVNLVRDPIKGLEAQLNLKGHAEIMGITAQAEVLSIKNAKQAGVLLKALVPENELPQGFNKLPIHHAAFVATTIEYTDPETKVTYNPNSLNLTGKVTLSGVLEPLGKMIGSQNAQLNVLGAFDPKKPTDNKISVELSKGIPIKGHVVSIGPVIVDIRTKNASPYFDLQVHLILRPNSKDRTQELDFSGTTSYSALEIAGNLRMDGMWRDPFGLKGLSIGDMSISLGINPQTFPETLIPSKFDLGGRLGLAPDKIVSLAIAINFVDSQAAFLGSLEGADGKLGTLSLLDIITLIADRLGANVPQDKIPVLEVEEPHFSFALQDTSVGAIKIPQGIKLKGKIQLLSSIAEVDFGVSKSGIMAKGEMTPVNLGPLRITAAKTAKGEVRKTKYGGPQIDIEFTSARQNFVINALMELDSMFSGSGDMEVSKDGINFNFEVSVGPNKLFNGLLNGQSMGSLSNPDFKLLIEMEQKFTRYAQEQISKYLKDAENSVRNNINQAVQEIKKIDNAIEQHKKDMQSAINDIEKAKKDLDAIDSASKEAEVEINKWKKDVDKLKIDIDKAKAQIAELKKKEHGWNVVGHIGQKAKILVLEDRISKLESSRAIANAALEYVFKKSATGTLAISKKTAEAALTTGRKFLEAVRSVDIAAMELTRDQLINSLGLARDAGIGVLQGTNFVFTGLLKGFMVDKVRFQSTLGEVKKGQLFDIQLDMHLLGKPQILKTKFDLKDISKSIESLSKEIINKFVPKF